MNDALKLAAIIRHVDGNHDLSADGLAEAILAAWNRRADQSPAFGAAAIRAETWDDAAFWLLNTVVTHPKKTTADHCNFVVTELSRQLHQKAEEARALVPPTHADLSPALGAVKPLQWDTPCAANNYTHIARSIFGCYYVGIDGGCHQAWLEAHVKPYENLIGDETGSLYEAQSFAQSDHNARVCELVTTLPGNPLVEALKLAEIAAVVGAAAMRGAAGMGANGVDFPRGEQTVVRLSGADCGAPYIGKYTYIALSAIRALPLPGDPLAEALKLPEVIEIMAELIYLRQYGRHGAIWDANDSKDVWRDKAIEALEAKP